MSEMGRLAMSGPEVIEASHGVDEFDARDRALVWRTTGGKHRLMPATATRWSRTTWRRSARRRRDASARRRGARLRLRTFGAAAALAERARLFAGLGDGRDVWEPLGVPDRRGSDADRGRDDGGRGREAH